MFNHFKPVSYYYVSRLEKIISLHDVTMYKITIACIA